MKLLRPYQEVACDYIDKHLKNYRRPFVYVMSCGTGKSLVIAEISKRWGKVLVLTLNKELCKQDLDGMKEYGVRATAYSASLGSKIVSGVTVATVGSAYKHPSLFNDADVVLIDECQQVDCGKNDSMFMKLLIGINKNKIADGKRLKVVGLTATAWRNVQKVKKNSNWYTTTTLIQPLNRIPMRGGFLWGDIEEGISTKEALEAGYLTPLEYYRCPIDAPLTINTTGAEFTDESLDNWGGVSVERCLALMKGAEGKWGARSGLVTVPFIHHAEALQRLAETEGLSTVVVSSKTPRKERERAITAFKSGEIRWLIQCNITNVGFNSPITDTLIWARPTLSLGLYVQAVGRIMRLSDGKKVSRVLDLTGTSKTFGRVEDIHLGKEDKFKTTVEGSGGRKLSGVPLKTFYWSRNISW